jgi:Skp family chaperone for outer membrane proteins
MNHTKSFLALSIGFLLCSATAQATHIVTIEGEKVLKESEPGVAINAKLMKQQEKMAAPLKKQEQEIKDGEKKFVAAKKDFDKKLKDLQGKGSELLSNEAKEQKAEKLRKEGQALEDMQMSLQKKVQRFQEQAKEIEQKMNIIYQQEMGAFNKQIQEVIEKVAKREEWDIALMKESTIFANPDTDKTKMIVDELNKGHKKSAAPKASAA